MRSIHESSSNKTSMQWYVFDIVVSLIVGILVGVTSMFVIPAEAGSVYSVAVPGACAAVLVYGALLVVRLADRFREIHAGMSLDSMISVTIDENYRITSCSRAFEKLVGKKKSSLKNRNLVAELVPQSAQSYVRYSMNICVTSTHSSRHVEFPVIRADGTQREIFWHITSKSTREGHPVGFSCIGMDTTGLTRTDALPFLDQEVMERFSGTDARFSWLQNTEGLLYATESFEQLWGVSRESIYGSIDALLKPVHHDDRKTAQMFFCCDPKHDSVEREFRIQNADGTERWIRVRSYPIESYSSDRRVGIAEDITEAQSTWNRLRHSEQKFRMVAEKLPVLLFAYDSNHVPVFWNSECERVTGYSTDEIVGNPHAVSTILPEYSIFDETLKNRQGTTPVERELTNRDGSQRIISWRHDVQKTLDGTQLTWAIGTDVTEKRETEEALQAEHEQVRVILNSFRDPVYVADPDTYECLYANAALTKQFGDVLGRKCYEAFHNLSSPCAFCTNRIIMDEDSTEPYIWEFYNKKSRRWYRCLDRAIRWSDGRRVRLEIAYDITEQKQAEQALRHRLDMETKLASISANLLSVSADGLNHAFETALAEFGILLKARRACLTLFDSDSESPAQHITWQSGRTEQDISRCAVCSAADCSWFLAELRKNHHCIISHESPLPDEAENLRTVLQQNAPLTVCAVPVISENTLKGVLAFESESYPYVWLEGDISILEGQGSVFAAALERASAEKAILESEQRLDVVVSGAGLATWDWDIETDACVFNDKWAQMLGTSLDSVEPVFDLWRKSIHPDDRLHIGDLLNDHLSGLTHRFEAEYRIVTATGQTKWVLGRAKIVHHTSDGTPQRMAGTHLDVTQRREAEEALRQSEERFRTLVDSMGDIVFTLNHDLRCLNAFGRWSQAFGINPADLSGRTLVEMSVPAGIAQCENACRKALEGEHGVQQWNAMHEDTLLSFSASASPLRGIDGEVTGVVVVARDMTDTRRAETALYESQKFLRGLLRSIKEACILIGTENLIVLEANDAATHMLGYTADDMRSQYLSECYSDDTAFTELSESLISSLDEPRFLTISDHQLRRKDGSVLTVEMSIVSLARNEDGENTWIAIMRDVSDRIRMESHQEQVQRMEAIGRLAGEIAHDFNNLLTLISGYAELLQLDIRYDDPMLRYVEGINKAANKAAVLTENLLTFGRKAKVESRAVDFVHVIRDIEQLLRQMIGENISLSIHIQDELWPVQADSGQIEQIIFNMAANARDAMPDGGKFAISLKNTSVTDDENADMNIVSPGEYVLLKISDTGAGMDNETKEHIFEPFFSTKGDSGTGIGLATVYGIVRQHHGEIWCDSTRGSGTEFTIVLPRATGNLLNDESVSRKTSETVHQSTEPQEEQTILLVEDEENVLAMSAQVLRKRKYHVLEARTGAEALTIAKEHDGTIHLILADIVLPDINGHEVAQSIVRDRPDTKILCTSGYTDDVTAAHGNDVEFLPKPYRLMDLLQKVRQILAS